MLFNLFHNSTINKVIRYITNILDNNIERYLIKYNINAKISLSKFLLANR